MKYLITSLSVTAALAGFAAATNMHVASAASTSPKDIAYSTSSQPSAPAVARYTKENTSGLVVMQSTDRSLTSEKSRTASSSKPSYLMALGDSFISGEGNGMSYYTPATSNPGNDPSNSCHLSYKSYPFILGEKYFDSYNSVACSGAKMEDITGYYGYRGQASGQTSLSTDTIIANRIPGHVEQMRFIEKYQPDTVLLSIGGNDVKFKRLILSCVYFGTCYNTQSSRRTLLETIYSQHESLKNVYTAIKSKPGVQRVYVVGYPRIVNPDGNCGNNVHLNESEAKFAAGLTAKINRTIMNAAQSAGVEYVDIEDAFAGNMLCDTTSSFAVNGVLGRVVDGILAESYHPTVYGHELIATRIDTATNALMKPMPAATGTGRYYVGSEDTSFIEEAKKQ